MKSMRLIRKNCQEVPDRERGLVVAIDVSKRKMDFAAYRPGMRSEHYCVEQDPAGLRAFADLIEASIAEGYEPWVAFEPTGPYSTCLKEWLISSGWHAVQVNPYHVRRTKEVRDNSPNKTDAKDPSVIADLVWQGCYRKLVSLSGPYAELRAASVEWRSLTKRRTAIRNEFQALLEVWFPELGQVFKDAVCKSVQGIVRKYPTAAKLACTRISSVRSCLRHASKGRSTSRAEQVLLAAKSSMAPSSGQGARHRAMVFLLDMLESIDVRREQLLCEMNQLLSELKEAECLLSIKGIGVITVGSVLGECGNIGEYGSYAQLEKHLGLNLYEVSSGQHKGERHISKRGRAGARYAICYVAMTLAKPGYIFAGYADELRAKGKKAGQVRVAVARRLLAMLYALARDCESFDPQVFFTGARAEHGLVIQQGAQAKAA